MLYKKILYTGYITLQFLATRTTGGDIYISASQTSCSGTGTCNVYCDTASSGKGYVGPAIECGSASACNVYVTADKCLEVGSITAGGTGQILTAYCQAGECFKKTDIYGDTGAEITVYCDSSQATGKVIVGDECKRLRIHGETARFVKVQVHANSNLYGSKDSEDMHAWIKCPINSDYSGPEPAPCVIDANGAISMTTVWAYEGTPADFAVTGSATNVDIDLKCYRNSAWLEVEYSIPGTCSRSRAPTKAPTENPTTKTPTKNPTKNPTKLPTKQPTKAPTSAPTGVPTKQPTANPTKLPTKQPTKAPTSAPTGVPTSAPTGVPTKQPTANPTKAPTSAPTSVPTKQPTKQPTKAPTSAPTGVPTSAPTSVPTKQPTANPTKAPTSAPTGVPTSAPTGVPTKQPTKAPTSAPTDVPTTQPTTSPTPRPTPPGTVVCGLPLSGAYNGEALIFNVEIPFDGDMTFDATSSSLTVPANGLHGNGVLDDGVGDAAGGQRGVLTLQNLAANTYQFSLDLGAASGSFGVVTQCTSDAPTKVPTNLPTKLPTANPTNVPSTTPTSAPTKGPTPKPIAPGTIQCGDISTGDYNGGELTFSVNVLFDSVLTFDASSSTPSVTTNGLQKLNPGGILDNGNGDDNGDFGAITVRVTAGTYAFSLDLGTGTGGYAISTQCTSDAPTNAPTDNPTDTPSELPTQGPSREPSTSPTLLPTNVPTSVPTDAPTVNPTDQPTATPTEIPTDNPTSDPTKAPSPEPTEKNSAEVDEDDQGEDDNGQGEDGDAREVDNANENDGNTGAEKLTQWEYVVIAVTLSLIVCCCFFGYFILNRVRKFKNHHLWLVANLSKGDALSDMSMDSGGEAGGQVFAL